jgi:hypothetical protein
LPTGGELTGKIAKKLDLRFRGFSNLVSGDPEIAQALVSHARSIRKNPNEYLEAAWRIRDAMPQASSIDAFIDQHKDDADIEFCGKLAIAQIILEAESKSALKSIAHPSKPYQTLNFSKLPVTWYDAFWKLLTAGKRLNDVGSLFSNVSFIVFNYDRCLEQLLYYSLKNTYGITDYDCAKILKRVQIFHPYGTVGPLSWQDAGHHAEFGETHRTMSLVDLAAGIKTFTEGIEDEVALRGIHACMQDAQTIVFLGFAYHDLNLSILATGVPLSPKLVIGSAMGISGSDSAVIQQELRRKFQIPASESSLTLLPGKTCSDLFQEFQRTLSLA